MDNSWGWGIKTAGIAVVTAAVVAIAGVLACPCYWWIGPLKVPPVDVVPGDVEVGANGKISGSVVVVLNPSSGFASSYGGGCLIYANSNPPSCTNDETSCGKGGYCAYSEDYASPGAEKVCWYQPVETSCWKSCQTPTDPSPIPLKLGERQPFNEVSPPAASGPVRWRVVSRQNENQSCTLYTLRYGHIRSVP